VTGHDQYVAGFSQSSQSLSQSPAHRNAAAVDSVADTICLCCST